LLSKLQLKIVTRVNNVLLQPLVYLKAPLETNAKAPSLNAIVSLIQRS
jgi:hypothetical protein